ncbi:MAG: glycosidase [Candidatus Brocadiia bacterium]|jgi:predicted GH43/DUF377 family glycosyl hydrolase|nr:glycosidase [Candidatus Brocadiia bacterium]
MGRGVFSRYKHNPLITVRDLPYQSNTVFNAGVADLGDEVVLLVRIESCSGRSHITVARSKDGVKGWKFEEQALMHPVQDYPYESYGVEDCRITRMEDLDSWALVYTAYSEIGAGVALAMTKDFRTVERRGIMFPPEDKDAALFPSKIGDRYAIIHRPAEMGGNIWVSYSPDLTYWGKSQLVLAVRGGPWWDGARVGAGLPPIRTDAGWLIIYHGVKIVARRPIYRVGAALLDLEDPHRMIGRARRWLMSPDAPYEWYGDAPNVVFPSGGFIRGDELWIYYGAADSCICLATAKLDDVLNIVLEESVGGPVKGQ